MVDANVVVYASKDSTRESNSTEKAMQQASRVLLMSLPELLMCSISLAEVMRSVTDEELATLSGLIRHPFEDVLTYAVTGKMARLAAELLSIRDRGEVCRKCLNLLHGGKPSPPCSMCNGAPSRFQRLDDALIVSCAVLSPGVTRLISTDGGVLHLGTLLGHKSLKPKYPEAQLLRVREPGYENGPLFGQEEPAPKRAAKGRSG